MKHFNLKKQLAFMLICLVATFTACNDNSNGKTDIDITVCGVHNPEWLLGEIDDVVNRGSGNYRAVQVYSISYSTQEYILICDLMNSSYVDGHLLYTCNGQSIASNDTLYEALILLFVEKECTLLWTN